MGLRLVIGIIARIQNITENDYDSTGLHTEKITVTTELNLRKSISTEKCGILSKGPKYVRKYVCSSLAVARQRVYDSSTETNNEDLLISRQRFHNHGYIDNN
jgi:hypothetical protein